MQCAAGRAHGCTWLLEVAGLSQPPHNPWMRTQGKWAWGSPALTMRQGERFSLTSRCSARRSISSQGSRAAATSCLLARLEHRERWSVLEPSHYMLPIAAGVPTPPHNPKHYSLTARGAFQRHRGDSGCDSEPCGPPPSAPGHWSPARRAAHRLHHSGCARHCGSAELRAAPPASPQTCSPAGGSGRAVLQAAPHWPELCVGRGMQCESIPFVHTSRSLATSPF